MIEIHPKDRNDWLSERTRDVTSTDVAALFDCSPYQTRFGLWHQKKLGTIEAFEPSDRMKWGTRLEDAIAHGVAEDQGWDIRKKSEYVRSSDRRMGASFDYEITAAPKALLEIKNVDALMFRENWLVDEDSIEAPPHIELQVQHQLAVTGHEEAFIAALVGGNRTLLLRRERNETVINAIKSAVDAFWESIEKNQPPEPSFPTDAQAVCKLYADATPGKVLDASMSQELARIAKEYAEAGKQEKWASELRETLKAQMLRLVGDHEKVIGDGFTISASVVKGGPVSYERKDYRGFRVTWPKVRT